MFHVTRFARRVNPHTASWVQRHATDPFVHQARRDGYVCRSAYKLLHVADRFTELFVADPSANDDDHHSSRPRRRVMTWGDERQTRRSDTTATATRIVVDLGAAPGSWSQVVRKRAGDGCRVIAVDLTPLATTLPGVHFVKGDFTSAAVQRRLRQELGTMRDGHDGLLAPPQREGATCDDREGQAHLSSVSAVDDSAQTVSPSERLQQDVQAVLDAAEREESATQEREPRDAASAAPSSQSLSGANVSSDDEQTTNATTTAPMVDVVLSDMCPNRRGGLGDHHAALALAEKAFAFAVRNLRPHGHFVCKVLGQAHEHGLRAHADSAFRQVHVCKPPASRQESDESFLVCLDFLGGSEANGGPWRRDGAIPSRGTPMISARGSSGIAVASPAVQLNSRHRPSPVTNEESAGKRFVAPADSRVAETRWGRRRQGGDKAARIALRKMSDGLDSWPGFGRR